MGAWSHGDQGLGVVVPQGHLVPHLSLPGLGVAAVGVGDARLLAVVDADQAERPAKLFMMITSGRGDDQCPARGQDSGGLDGVPRPEHAQDAVRGAIGQRQRLPRVRAPRRGPRMGASGPAQRRNRQVEADPGAAGQAIQDPGQVIPGAARQIGDDSGVPVAGIETGRLVEVPGRERRDRVGDRPVVSPAQEQFARRDHRGAVTRAWIGATRAAGPARTRAGGDQVHVTLAGDIEAMPVLARQLCVIQEDGASAHWAAQVAADRRERLPPPAARNDGRVGRVVCSPSPAHARDLTGGSAWSGSS